MKKFGLILTALSVSLNGYSFCGFYVAKADAKLFNRTSQVIIVHNGERSTITMSSDFKGDVKDFAMVVPVPVVLEKKDIKISNRLLFDKFDAYSAPRLVEYYDEDPCPRVLSDSILAVQPGWGAMAEMSVANGIDMGSLEQHKVTIEAQYTVGEYDILILSAKESGGLYLWLTENGYKVPDGAQEVLDPYIKSNMKFFVCKVNLGQYEANGAVPLSPLQISFNSPKFMLPIRLGMANADGPQDMIVYAFSTKGRIETANYRTVPVPTDMKVPLFVQQEFGAFYKDLYTKAWKREDKDVVFLEYAWEVSPMQNVFCDPCVGDPPMVADLKDAGVDWMESKGQDYHTGGNVYAGNVYFTRLHVTYARNTFPQDLMFQETPNKQKFQARYVLTHPASSSDFSCDKGQAYLQELNKRRWDELYTYQWLSGREISSHLSYPTEYNVYLKKKEGTKQGTAVPFNFSPPSNKPGGRTGMGVVFLSFATLAAILFALSRSRKFKTTVV
ncbi:MAG TPA: DUF2330 domain-containing protein [Bacteroidia bacterium]|nr:DUF2330 domain-containing protein [Bacteroidia bacterium]